MSKEWLGIVDIIPDCEGDSGWYVYYHGTKGLIYDNEGCWNLLLEVKAPAGIAEKKWLSLCCLMLLANGELGCSLCQFQGKWWLGRRYATYGKPFSAEEIAMLHYSLNEQLSLSNFLGQGLLLQKSAVPAPLSLISAVINKWG